MKKEFLNARSKQDKKKGFSTSSASAGGAGGTGSTTGGKGKSGMKSMKSTSMSMSTSTSTTTSQSQRDSTKAALGTYRSNAKAQAGSTGDMEKKARVQEVMQAAKERAEEKKKLREAQLAALEKRKLG
tara:strand:+ start:45 stop:428 length:384 start_codon:yes stop_codon:yes gene_type:complete